MSLLLSCKIAPFIPFLKNIDIDIKVLLTFIMFTIDLI